MTEFHPNLSNKLFKYGPVKNVKRTLEGRTLGFRSLSRFNDIYEDDYRLTHYFKSEKERERLVTPSVSATIDARTKIDAKLAATSVTCFSPRADISLMWSHYSDNHEGVCYCFGSERYEEVFEGNPINWGNVNYSSQLPEITIFQDQTTVGMLDDIISDIILTKPTEWSYEEEIRFWTAKSVDAVQYDVSKLTAIIVGRRTSDADINDIELMIAEFNKNNDQNVELWYSIRQPSTFRLGVSSKRDVRTSQENSISDRIPIFSNTTSAPVTS